MQVLKDIQEFTQISRKQIIFKNEVIDLRGVLEKAITLISSLAYKKNVELYTQFSPGFPITVRGDAERIQQIAANIMTSSLDYAEGGSLLLDIRYAEGGNVSNQLKFTVYIEQPVCNSEIELKLHDAFSPHYADDMVQGLSLAIAKGL